MRDLFQPDHEGYLTDPALLDRLVTEKLERKVSAIRKEGWKWVEIVPDASYETLRAYGRVNAERDPLTAKEQKQLDKLATEYDALVSECGDEPDDETADRLAALEEQIDVIKTGEPIWQQEALAQAGAILTIGYGGKLRIERGLVKSEDKKAVAASRKANASGESAEEAVTPYSAALVEDLTAQRTAALRAMLKDNVPVALASVAHALALPLFYSHSNEAESCLDLSIRSHYAFSDVSPIEPLIGKDATQELKDALRRHWRRSNPKLVSEREPDKLNTVRLIDCMGLTGVTIEATDDPDWAKRLSQEDAVRAARYGLMEINGLPDWFGELASVHPTAVHDVIMAELKFEFPNTDSFPRQTLLFDVVRGGASVARSIIPDLLEITKSGASIAEKSIPYLADCIVFGGEVERDEFATAAIERFRAANDSEMAVAWLAAAFKSNLTLAIAAFQTKLNALTGDERRKFGEKALPAFFGDGMYRSSVGVDALPFDLLTKLIDIAFDVIKPSDDRPKPQEVYTPDQRDHAERARSALFNRLVEIPGRATFAKLGEYAKQKDPLLPGWRLRELAERRAWLDSETVAWPGQAVLEFETQHAVQARTSAELQQVIMRQVSNIQYDLFEERHGQAETVKSLRDEAAVQKWTAKELITYGRNTYKTNRDPISTANKRPDIRIESTVSTAGMAIEIKAAHSWSLKQLEEALTEQLTKLYIRDRQDRCGVLLLVYQGGRNRGWLKRGKPITFKQVVAHLEAIAAKKAGEAPDAPQARIAVIDVSTAEGDGPVKSKSRKKNAARKPVKKNSVKKKAGTKPKKVSVKRVTAKPAASKKKFARKMVKKKPKRR